jgi:hypothetical protein
LASGRLELVDRLLVFELVPGFDVLAGERDPREGAAFDSARAARALAAVSRWILNDR